jgi:hypothetical protein
VTPEDDYYGQMRAVPLDDTTADRLLSGMISPDDAPPGYAGLAALVQTLQRPGESAHTNPPAAEASLIAAMADAVASSRPPATSVPRRSSVLSRLLTAKIAAAATVAAFGLGTAAAAATGSLPRPTSHASPRAAGGLATASSHYPSVPPAAAHGAAPVATPAASTPTSLPGTGPANMHTQFGLCTAFLAANAGTGTSTSSTMPPRDASTAFQALISQHRGVAATTAYCTGVAHPGKPSSAATPAASGAAGGSAAGSPAGKPATPGQPAHTGKPADVGKPASTGKPSSAGSSAGHARVPTPNPGGTGTAATASGGASATGTATANAASGGASSAGSGNATTQGH